jgi:ParB family chromosome partitioning protein
VLDAFYRYAGAESCVEISVRGGSLGTHAPGLGDSPSAQAIEQRNQAWADRLPDDPDQLWETLSGFSADEQAALFAHCAASGINAVWEPANRYNDGRVSARTVAGRLAHSHVLARAAGLDPVAAGWTATVDNYLGRVTKARILSAIEEAKGAEVSARIAGLKKPDMAREAESLLDGSGWLAEPLRTPVPVEPDTPPAAPVANDDPVPLGTDRAEADADAESFAIAAE